MSLFKRKEKEKTAEEWILEGNSLRDMERYDEAIIYYDKALELDPEDPDASELKGYLLRDLQRHDEAIECFDKALELNPEDPDLWGNQGNALLQLQRYDEAIECFDKALELNPMYDKAWSFKGVALYRLDRCDEAITCYDRALEIEPEDSAYVLELKEMVFRGERKTAEEWFQLGFDAKDPEKQVEYYTKALELDPDDSITWYDKGNALRELGQYDEAIKCYDKALDLKPDNDRAWYNKGTILGNELDRLDEAISCFDKVLELDPKDAPTWAKKAFALSTLERYDEAITCYDKSLQFDPDNAITWNNKGWDLKNIGRLNEAITCFDKSLEIDPNHEHAKNNREISVRELKRENTNEKGLEGKTAENYLAKVNLELFKEGIDLLDGDPIEAIDVLEKRIDEYPNESILWYFMGQACAKVGDDIKTLEYYDRAIELEPQNFLAWKERGLLLSNKKPLEAIKCFDKAIELYEDAKFWYYKGIVLANLEEHEDAVYCLSKALEVEYEFIQDWHYVAWYQKGVSLYELDEHEEAITCFNKSIEINPKDSDNWARKAGALNKLGRLDDALECMEKANKLKADRSNEQRNEAEKISKQISTLNSEINHLAKDRVEKFSEAGELAYSECVENAPELATDAQTELDDILAIDTLISKTNQEMEKAKSGKKKTGFLAKLGDTVSSVAKQGKLKVELYNLEKKKKSTTTDFGEALWESHKSGDDTLQELSDIWHAIEDIEQQIHENEEEINNLNELLE